MPKTAKVAGIGDEPYNSGKDRQPSAEALSQGEGGARQEPAFRFYRLYDKIYRSDILTHAYALARHNGGAPGVDGVTFETIEASGVEGWLAALREELVSRTYRPRPVRRVMIPKPGDGERPLGIPTIRDRSSRPPPSWCWSRSSRRTWKTAPMDTGPNEARSTPSS